MLNEHSLEAQGFNFFMYLQDFMKFKVSIAISLMGAVQEDIRENQYFQACEAPAESTSVVPESMRLDQVAHWNKYRKEGHGHHCKVKGCKGRTMSYCTKCLVYICNKPGKSCFIDWHTKAARYVVPKSQ